MFEVDGRGKVTKHDPVAPLRFLLAAVALWGFFMGGAMDLERAKQIIRQPVYSGDMRNYIKALSKAARRVLEELERLEKK